MQQQLHLQGPLQMGMTLRVTNFGCSYYPLDKVVFNFLYSKVPPQKNLCSIEVGLLQNLISADNSTLA